MDINGLEAKCPHCGNDDLNNLEIITYVIMETGSVNGDICPNDEDGMYCIKCENGFSYKEAHLAYCEHQGEGKC